MIEGILFMCRSSDEFIVVHLKADPGYKPIIGRFKKGVLNFSILGEKGYYISRLVKLNQKKFDLRKKNTEIFIREYEKGQREYNERFFGQLKGNDGR